MQTCKYILCSTGLVLLFLASCAERLLLIALLGGAGIVLLIAALVIEELQVRLEEQRKRRERDAFYTGRIGSHPSGRRGD